MSVSTFAYVPMAECYLRGPAGRIALGPLVWKHTTLDAIEDVELSLGDVDGDHCRTAGWIRKDGVGILESSCLLAVWLINARCDVAERIDRGSIAVGHMIAAIFAGGKNSQACLVNTRSNVRIQYTEQAEAVPSYSGLDYNAATCCITSSP